MHVTATLMSVAYIRLYVPARRGSEVRCKLNPRSGFGSDNSRTVDRERSPRGVGWKPSHGTAE
jgi:hypothetical protein